MLIINFNVFQKTLQKISGGLLIIPRSILNIGLYPFEKKNYRSCRKYYHKSQKDTERNLPQQCICHNMGKDVRIYIYCSEISRMVAVRPKMAIAPKWISANKGCEINGEYWSSLEAHDIL